MGGDGSRANLHGITGLIKGLMVVLPFLTLYATARLFAPRRVSAASLPPIPYQPAATLPIGPFLPQGIEKDRLERFSPADIEPVEDRR